MGRIRTVKPELFRHEELFNLEKSTGLPVRIAWVGMFSVCDREGRFRWKPRELKLDVLPHDEIDFEKVLHALVRGGFLIHYRIDGKEFGCIPTFKSHQIINNKEKPSQIPSSEHPNCEMLIDFKEFATREARVRHACATPLNLEQVEGKGREGKGKGKGKGYAPDPRVDHALPNSEVLIPGPESAGEGGTPQSRCIGEFVSRWAQRHGGRYPMSGKDASLVGGMVKSLGEPRAKEIIAAYFKMPDAWIVGRKHDVVTLNSSLAKVAAYADTGEFTTQGQVRQMDRTATTVSLIERIKRGEV